MKKYDLSKIMKRAWYLVKWSFLDLSTALKKAWAERKRELERAEKLANMKSYFWGSIGFCSVHFNIAEGIVSGSTYKCKETLKAYGLKFNGHEKYWEGTSAQVKELALDYM